MVGLTPRLSKPISSFSASGRPADLACLATPIFRGAGPVPLEHRLLPQLLRLLVAQVGAVRTFDMANHRPSNIGHSELSSNFGETHVKGFRWCQQNRTIIARAFRRWARLPSARFLVNHRSSWRRDITSFVRKATHRWAPRHFAERRFPAACALLWRAPRQSGGLAVMDIL